MGSTEEVEGTFSSAEEVLPWHRAVQLPAAILEAPTPSSRDGVSLEVEQDHRAFGCMLICEAGHLLHLTQVVVATAQNLFHRFYWRKSLKDVRFDAFSVAMGCIFLATKVEEQIRTLRQIIYVFHYLYRRRKYGHIQENDFCPPPPDKDATSARLELGGVRYNKWKKTVITMERHVLKELGFGFYQVMEHPHKFILYYIEYLRRHGMEASDEQVQVLAQHAWAYLNDSMRLDLCVRYDSRHIACAATFIASRHADVQIQLPSPEWLLVLGVDPGTVYSICDVIAELYEREIPIWCEPLHPDSIMSQIRQEVFDAEEEGRAASEEAKKLHASEAPSKKNESSPSVPSSVKNGSSTYSLEEQTSKSDKKGRSRRSSSNDRERRRRRSRDREHHRSSDRDRRDRDRERDRRDRRRETGEGDGRRRDRDRDRDHRDRRRRSRSRSYERKRRRRSPS